jgi:hypothetical protein
MNINQIILFILIAILIASLYQIYIVRKIKKGGYGDNQLADSKYFELKYQIESYVKLFAVLIAIATYLGYNSFSKAKSEIEKAYVEPLDKYKSKLDSINEITKTNEEFIKRFSLEKEAIKSVLLKSGNDAKGIERDINLLAASRINQLKIYVIPVKITQVYVPNEYKMQKFYFKDLKTHDGRNLPKFKNPPFMDIPGDENQIGNAVYHITTESFDLPAVEKPTIAYLWLLSDD